MRRAALSVLAVWAIGQMVGCANLIARSVPKPAVPQVKIIGIDSAMGRMFQDMRERLYGHSTLPDVEQVLCLYGVIQHDTAYVLFVRSPLQEQTAHTVKYQPCPRPAAERFGDLRYLGTQHNHPPGNHRGLGIEQACWYSIYDTQSFEGDPFAIVDLVSCDRLMGRLKGEK